MVGTLSIVVYLLPLLVLGPSATVRVHDHIDSIFAYATVISKNGLVFSSGETLVAPIMGGLKRWYFNSPISIYMWLFAVFPPFAAMVLNEILIRVVAFTGAYLFTRDDVLEEGDTRIIALLAAACFAAIPFFPTAEASIAGLPLVAWAAQRVRHGERLIAASVAAGVFVLYSWLVLSGVFFLAAVGLLAAYDLVSGARRRAYRLAGFLAAVSFGYIVREHQLLASLFSSGAELTNRAEMLGQTWSVKVAVYSTVLNFLEGQHHAPTFAAPVILLLAMAAVGTVAWDTLRARRLKLSKSAVMLAVMLLAAGVTSLIFGFWRVHQLQATFEALGLPYFDISRFHFLQPAIWLAIFASAATVIVNRFAKLGLYVVLAASLAQITFAASKNPWYEGPIPDMNAPYDAYLAQDTYAKIAKTVDPKTAVFGNVGLEPAIAQFNGLKTVDGYMVMYPLYRKKQIRAVVSRELDEDPKLEYAFDHLSNRAYLASSELACIIACDHAQNPATVHLDYDMDAFKRMGGTHILSARPIQNFADLKLQFLGAFPTSYPTQHPASIYLYKAM